MSKKDLNEYENDDNNHNVTGSIKTKVIFFILVITLAGGLFVYKDHYSLMSQLKSNELKVQKQEEIAKIQPQNPQTYHDNIADETYTFGLEPPLLDFGTDIEEAPKNKLENEDIVEKEDRVANTIQQDYITDPYENFADFDYDDFSEFAPAIPKPMVLKNANEYREMLLIFKTLLDKFEKNVEFSYEMKIIKEFKLPNEFDGFVKKLGLYNDLISNPEFESYSKIDSGVKFLDKLFKLKKKSNNFKIAQDLKQDINKDIKRFNEYIYSEEFQNRFFGK